MTSRKPKSLLTELLLKAAIVFYLIDVLLNTGDGALTNVGIQFNILNITKLILVFGYATLILAVQKSLFRKIGFLTLIFGAAFKALMYISSPEFTVVEFINIAPEVLIISFSTYYMYRAFATPPRKKIKSTKRRRWGKTS